MFSATVSDTAGRAASSPTRTAASRLAGRDYSVGVTTADGGRHGPHAAEPSRRRARPGRPVSITAFAANLAFSRAAVDGSHLRALERGSKTGHAPSTGARTGSEHHLITDATGIPLAVALTGNRNEVTQLIPLPQAAPPVRGNRGRPRRRPDVVLGDRGYDQDPYRRLV